MTERLPVAIEPPMDEADLAALRAAIEALERASFAQRLSVLAGRQIGAAARAVPEPLREAASAAAGKALSAALRIAISSLPNAPSPNHLRLHRRLAAASGAIGGAIGFAALPFELPISTTIMLRSIADIARFEGEDLADPETALACLQVFALGGLAEDGGALEGGYLAVRGLLAKSVSDAARYVATRSIADETAPVMARLIGQIASRFGIVVSQKTAAQAVPLVGALGGAALNLAFTEHFQTVAHGHFTVRRLERAYGAEMVRREYARLSEGVAPSN